MGDRRGSELTPDQIALIVIGVASTAVLFARGQQLLVAAGDWLRGHHLLAAGSDGELPIPLLGSLGASRLMILAGAAMILVVLVRVGRRAGRRVGRRHGGLGYPREAGQ